MDAESPTEVKPPPSRWRQVRRAGAVVVLLWAVATGCTVNGARNDLGVGKSALVELAALDPLDSDFVVLQAKIVSAHESVASGASKLNSPLLWPLRPLPVAGRQLGAARALANTADAVLDDTELTVASAIKVNDAPPEHRADRLAELGSALHLLDSTISDRNLGPDHNLLAPLRDAQIEAEESLTDIGSKISDAAVVVDGLVSFLGDSHYLMLGANVNEMQAGGGTPLSFGEIRVTGGSLSVSNFQTIVDAPLDGPTPLVDQDIGDLWGFLNPTNDFKKLLLTHRFAEYSGPQALVMYEDSTNKRLGGVLLVDSVALQALLSIVGPVSIDGREFNADNVLNYLFVEQYAEFMTGDEVELDDLSTLSEGEEARYDLQAQLASATFAKVAAGDWDSLEMIRGLRPIAAGRHVLAFSQDPTEQAMWQQMGIAGTLIGNEVGVGLLNIGANKLDPYMQVDLVTTTSEVAGKAVLSIEVTVTNNTPKGLPDAVKGYYWKTLNLPSGETYLGRIMLLLPGSAVSVDLDPASEAGLEVFGVDGRNLVVVTRMILADGDRRVMTAEVTLDTLTTELRLMPSARVPAVNYQWNGISFTDQGPLSLPLDE